MHLGRALWLGLRQCLPTGVARALFIAESQGECKEKVQKPPKNRPTITGALQRLPRYSQSLAQCPGVVLIRG